MDEIEFFISQLKSDEFATKLNAINMLGEFADKRALPALIELLGDPEWQIRSAAVDAITKIKDDTVVDTIAKFLRSDDANLRNAAMQALEKLGADVVPILCENLKDSDTDVRIFAANTLGNIRDAKAVPSLLESLNDSDENVFYAVVEALGRIKDRSAVGELLKKLKEKDIWDRFVIITTLGNIGDESVIDELINQMEHEELRLAIIDALSSISYVGAIPKLTEIINSENDTDIKIEALKALFQIALNNYNFARIERNRVIHDYLLYHISNIDFRNLEPLILEIFQSEHIDLIAKTLQILIWANAKFPIRPIIPLLEKEEIEEQAYELLIKQSDVKLDEIKAILNEINDPNIGRFLIKSLGFNQNKGIFEFLEELLKSDIPQYIIASAEALLLHLIELDANEDLINKLFNLLKSNDSDISYSAKSILIVLAHSEIVSKKIKQIFLEQNEELLKAAIEIASISNKIEFLNDIISYIEHPDPNIRKEVFQTINYLSKIDINKKAILKHPLLDKIYNGVHDKDDHVKIEAILALGALCDDRAYECLKSLLFDTSFTYFRHYIARALKEFIDKQEVIDLFLEALQSGLDIETKFVIIDAFKTFKSSAPVDFLSDMLFEETEDDLKGEILKTIGEIGGVDDADYILPFLEEDNWFLKNSAIIALSQIKDDSVKEELLQLLKNFNRDNDEILIKSCINSLKNYPEVDVVQEIIKFLGEENFAFVSYETLYHIFSQNHSLANELTGLIKSQTNPKTLRLLISILRELKIPYWEDFCLYLLKESKYKSLQLSALIYLKEIGFNTENICKEISEDILQFFCKELAGE